MSIGLEVRKDLKATIVLIVIGVAVYLFAFPAPLTDGDTVFYAEIARNMVESGDWIVLRSERMPVVDKGPLTIWPIAISFALFEESPLTTRAWHIFVAIGCVVTTYFIAREFFDRKTSFVSGIVLLTTILFYYMGFVPQQDIPGLLLISLGMLFFIRAVRRSSLVAFYGIFITLGLGLLNRGLSGAAIPIGIMLVTLISLYYSDNRPQPPFSGISGWVLHIGLGIALMILVACPWYIAAYEQQGAELLDTLLFSGNTRFMSDLDGAANASGIQRAIDWLSYVPLLIVGFLPWSALLVPAVKESASRIKQQRSSSDIVFAAWTVVGLLFPFAIRWRVIRYLIPVFPPLAILIARYVVSLLAKEDRRPAVSERLPNPLRKVAIVDLAIIVPVFLLAVAYIVVQFNTEAADYLPFAVPILLSVSLSQIVFGVLALQRRIKAAIYSLPLISMAGLVTAMILLPIYWVQPF